MAAPGFRSFQSISFLPDGSTVQPPIGGFRSFESMMFLPDGVLTTPPVTTGDEIVGVRVAYGHCHGSKLHAGIHPG